jgi:hypothetical protein
MFEQQKEEGGTTMATKKRRSYDSLGRAILRILESGPRTFHVLLGYALSRQHGERSLRGHLGRLRNAGHIKFYHRRAGGRWGLTRARLRATAKGTA